MAIPLEMREQIAAHPLAGMCWRKLALQDHECEGRITWEHAILYNGKRVQEIWAIVMLCELAHNIGMYQDCGIMDKSLNEWIAINRMSKKDEKKYPRFNWAQRRKYLNRKYGRVIIK